MRRGWIYTTLTYCRPSEFTMVQLEKYLAGGLQSGHTVNLCGMQYKLHTKHKKVWYDVFDRGFFYAKYLNC